MANFDESEGNPSWNNMKTPKIMTRMLDLYETCKWHDRVFKLTDLEGTEELVFAHALILATSSPVFEALCFGPMAEDKPIEVPDIDPYAFRMMLKFIYTDCIEFASVEVACNVLYASKKYLVYSLVGRAVSYISYHINESNCLTVYNFAKFVQEDKLIKESWNYLCSHLDEILKYFSKESLSADLVKGLVNEESLNGNEIILYQICLMWAKAECENRNLEQNSQNLREVLIQADLLNKIRWLTLTLKEFEEGPQKSGILYDEEIKFVSKVIKLIDDLQSSTSEKGCKIAKLKDIKNSNVESLQNVLQEGTVFLSSINSNIEMRKRIQLKKFYCHRFIEKRSFVELWMDDLKIQTVIITNKSVRLTAIFLNSRILPNVKSNSGDSHSYRSYERESRNVPSDIPKNYNEKLLVSVFNSSGNVLFTKIFSENVNYGTIVKISVPSSVILEQSNKYTIQIDLLNIPKNYLLGYRNTVSEFPSGLSVKFEDLANIGENNTFAEARHLSILSGLELSL